MKFKHLFAGFAALCILSSAIVAFGAETQSPNQPSVFFPEITFEFPAVLEGAEVLHDFVIKNIGTAPLQVEKVGTG